MFDLQALYYDNELNGKRFLLSVFLSFIFICPIALSSPVGPFDSVPFFLGGEWQQIYIDLFFALPLFTLTFFSVWEFDRKNITEQFKLNQALWYCSNKPNKLHLLKRLQLEESLVFAVERNNIEAVNILLTASDLDVNHEYYGKAPLIAAVEANQIDMVRVLLAAPGIDVNQEISSRTPLIAAIVANKIDMVRVLLAAPGIDVNHEHHTLTPLILAASRGRLDIANVLLGKLSSEDLNYVNEGGFNSSTNAFLLHCFQVGEMCFALGGMLSNHYGGALGDRPQRRQFLLRSLSAFHSGRFDDAAFNAQRNKEHRAFCLNPVGDEGGFNSLLFDLVAFSEDPAFHAFLRSFSADAALTEMPQAAIELSQPQQVAVLGLSPKHFLAYAAKPNFLLSDIIDGIKDILPLRLVSKAFKTVFYFSLKLKLLPMLDAGLMAQLSPSKQGAVGARRVHPVVSLLCQQTPPHSSMNFVPASSSQSSGDESPLRHLPDDMVTRIAAYLVSKC